MSLSEIAIKRPLLIVVIFTILILFGAQSYLNLNYNLLPKMEVKTVSVNSLYPGASAAEVETNVTKKLEDALSSLEGLDVINATSQEGVSQISINLKSNADLDKAERDVQRKVQQAMNTLPDNIEPPIVSKVNLEEIPVISAAVTAGMSSKQLYTLIDTEILPVLQNAEGVGQVNIIGGDERQIQVNIDPEKLRSYNLDITQVALAINNANRSYPAGNIETVQQQFALKFDANVTSVEQIRNLILSKKSDGGTIYLRNVATVTDATSKTTTINHFNGIPSVGIQVIKQSDANAVNVSKIIREQFTVIEKQYKSHGVKFDISSDQSEYTMASAHAVMDDLMIAIIIVGIVMLAFLHSFRSSLFVMVALPSSIIPTFIAMYALGFSLNLMSLMAISLVVGILVDDSIVVLENIYRHLEMGAEKRKAALDGRNEIGFTAVAITLVDVVVFLPLALSGGLIGSILKEFALVVVISTLMSLFVSFTITPMLASRFGKLENLTKSSVWGRINLGFEDIIDRVKLMYGRALALVLQKKRYILGGILLLLIGAIALVPAGFIGGTFIPAADKGELLVDLELAPSSSVYQTNMITQDVEKILLNNSNVESVFSSVGFVSGSVSGSSNNGNLAQLTVKLKKERNISSEKFGTDFQKEIRERIPGVIATAYVTSISGGGATSPIQINVKGLNLTALRSTAEKIKKIAEDVPGTQSVKLSVKDQKTEIAIDLNREKMVLYSIDASQVGSALQKAFSGDDSGKFKQNGNEYDILVSLEQSSRSNIEDVKNLSFTNADGQSFMLGQFADVKLSLGEAVLQRKSRLNSITINSNVIGRPVGTVSNEILKKVNALQLPAGITIETGGDVKNQSDAFASLGIALITAIILVYLVMVALYESVVYPFVVLFSIPVALIGALLALALTMETLNVFSIIGMIMLLGLVCKNGILIVDFTNQLRSEGQDVKSALLEAGKERLRPILMTTLAMILGMLPIALANGEGSELKNGMAWVIIGGLTSSMLLTLFIVPCMYYIFAKLENRFAKNKLNGSQQRSI